MRENMKVSALNLIELLNKSQYQEVMQQFYTKHCKKSMVSSPDTSSNDVLIVSSDRLRVFLSYGGREFTLYYLGGGDVLT
ncbi:transcriptional regulator, partial [Citrobacter amalonaticus]|uniref:transcriptional regulator n=1 Tax=Citrobacter amalonaticus TaxID=35703 RepID=UPI0006261B17